MKELLHFSANWCNPCKVMEPFVLDFISNNLDIKYTKIDVDSNSQIAKLYNVMSIPTLISLVDDKEFKRHVGVAKVSDLENLFV